MNLYQRSFVILAHIHCPEPWDFEEMQKAGVTAVILKVDDDGLNFVNGVRMPIPPGEDWLARGKRAMSRILEFATRPGSNILIARSTADLRLAKRQAKVAIILSFEGGKPLVGKLENVNYYHSIGMREMQLWWAVPSQLKTADNTHLSAFGEDVIREMNRRGVVVDLSHMTAEAFKQALSVTRAPLIISHTAVGELYNPIRSQPGNDTLSGTDHLNDAAIRAIARNGGSICVHFVTPGYIQARHGTKQATVRDLVDNIAYVRDLVGIEYVSLGPDFFPDLWYHWVEGAGRISLLPNVAREMVRRGFSDDEISKVLGGNLMRIFEQDWPGER
jgi:membrane dipeptidase